MSEIFRILIAYDGSACADSALEDLRFAGLHETDVHALTISVAEVWLPPSNAETDGDSNFLTAQLRQKQKKNLRIFEETQDLSEKAAKIVSTMFPGWTVDSEATYGSPAWEVLARADIFMPHLIVVGSEGLSMLERIWIGSVSQRIVTEARCSVRVARKSPREENSPVRLVVGFDGTAGAEKAVQSVAGRQLPAGSAIRLVIVKDLGDVLKAFSFEQHASDLEARGKRRVDRLKELGFDASLQVAEGNPKDLIVKEAEDFEADCIFVGATQHGGAVERFLLGSVSSAVTARAHCSVEVVRDFGF